LIFDDNLLTIACLNFQIEDRRFKI